MSKYDLPVRMLPVQSERVETGPAQFGADWPGIFIRGDNSMHYGITLSGALSRIPRTGGAEDLALCSLDGLAELLMSCDVHKRHFTENSSEHR